MMKIKRKQGYKKSFQRALNKCEKDIKNETYTIKKLINKLVLDAKNYFLSY